MARLDDAIAYQEAQHQLICSHYGCGGDFPHDGVLQKSEMHTPQKGSNTLPQAIAIDAIIYVVVIVVFYGILVLLLVGTNMHRFRRKKNRRRRNSSRRSSTVSLTPRTMDVKVSLSNLPDDDAESCITVV